MKDNAVFRGNMAETAEPRVSQMPSLMRVVHVGVIGIITSHATQHATHRERGSNYLSGESLVDRVCL